MESTLEPLSVSFQITPEDYARAVRAFTLRQPAAVIALVLSGLLICLTGLVLLLSVVLLLIGRDLATGAASPLILLPCMAIYLLFPASLLLIRPFMSARQARKNPDNFAPVTWEVDDGHFRIQSARAKTELAWEVFNKVLETKRYYLLVYAVNKRVFQFVPKQAFESSELETAFRRYVEAHIGPIK
jgi:hypothetical protein